MICERYETVVVPFPFAEIPIVKRRPVVVVSGARFNAVNGNTVVAMITTAKGSEWPSDIRIGDLDGAGLPRNCYIRWRLTTIPNDFISRKLGSLGTLDRLACERQMANMLL